MENLRQFEIWLEMRGCTILPLKAPYESLRWIGNKTGVLYQSGKTSGVYATIALNCFKKVRAWEGYAPSYDVVYPYKFRALELKNATIEHSDIRGTEMIIAYGFAKKTVGRHEIKDYAKANGYTTDNINIMHDEGLNMCQWGCFLDRIN